MTKPLFSMPSVAEQLQTLESDVPAIVMNQAGDDAVKRHLLEQTSYLNQQNVIIGTALDTLIEQAKLTNGRVTAMEPLVAKHEEMYEERDAKKSSWLARKGWAKNLGTAILIGVVVAVLNKYLFHA